MYFDLFIYSAVQVSTELIKSVKFQGRLVKKGVFIVAIDTYLTCTFITMYFVNCVPNAHVVRSGEYHTSK